MRRDGAPTGREHERRFDSKQRVRRGRRTRRRCRCMSSTGCRCRRRIGGDCTACSRHGRESSRGSIRTTSYSCRSRTWRRGDAGGGVGGEAGRHGAAHERVCTEQDICDVLYEMMDAYSDPAEF